MESHISVRQSQYNKDRVEFWLIPNQSTARRSPHHVHVMTVEADGEYEYITYFRTSDVDFRILGKIMTAWNNWQGDKGLTKHLSDVDIDYMINKEDLTDAPSSGKNKRVNKGLKFKPIDKKNNK